MLTSLRLLAALVLWSAVASAQDSTPKPATKKKTSAKATPRAGESSSKKATSAAATPSNEGSDSGGFRGTAPEKTNSTAAEKAKAPETEKSSASTKKKKPVSSSTTGSETAEESEGGKSQPAKENRAKPDPTAESTKPPDGETARSETKPTRAPAATLEPTELVEFAAQPPKVQALLTAALELTKLNLSYTYGSADPAQGGMDCSGTMYHVLRAQGFGDVPRDSSSQYVWARKAGPFFSVVSTQADSFEFKELLPGDLLFWTGTYQVTRDVPISHVMLYLGTEKKTGKRVMFGASDGRSYAGIQRWGVSVFDFKMPRVEGAEKARVDFVGYGRIPALREAGEKVGTKAPEPGVAAAAPDAKENAASTPVSKKKSSAQRKK